MPALGRIASGAGFYGAVGQIGGLTAVSRVLGFVRDILIAAFIGAGPVADAFFVAFKLPNLFRRLTAEGAMTNAFMPNYAKARQRGDRGAAALASEVQTTLLLALVAVTIAMELAMPLVISLIAPGFEAGGARHRDAVEFARLTMPYLPMISLVALWAAVANAHDQFLGAAATPIILNLCLIAGALVCGLGAWLKAFPLALALPVAGVLQMVLMQRVLARIDRRPRWTMLPSLGPASRKMWRAFLPAALGAGGMQINLLVDMILASTLPAGAISALYYADRIAQLPLGIIGIALGTALLPRLSRFDAAADHPAFARALAQACQLGLFFGLPAMAGAIVLAEQLIGGLFAYGAFEAARVAPVALVLVAYGAGIPAFILAKVLQPAFFATGDTRSPMVVAFLTIALNVLLSLALMRPFGVTGLALATSVASWLSVLLMAVLLYRRKRFAPELWRLLVPAVLMTAAMALALMAGLGLLARHPLDFAFGRAAEMLVLVLLGIGVYFGLAWGFDAWPRGDRARQGG